MLIDFTPVTGMNNSYTANPGGAPANVAVSAARSESDAGFLGKLGNDDFGKLLMNTLKSDGVEILGHFRDIISASKNIISLNKANAKADDAKSEDDAKKRIDHLKKLAEL